MNALITGAAGFIGSHLTARLLEQGNSVIGVDSFTDYYPRSLKEANLAVATGRAGFRFVEARVQDADLTSLLRGVTHVFDATQRLLEACIGLPLERFVYASSSSVYGDHVPLPMREDALLQPLSPYGVTKLAAEHLASLYWENHAVPTVSLRYFTVYGPRQRPDMGFHRFLRAALNDEPITVYGDGEQTRDFTFVADAVNATVAAAMNGRAGGVYNIGGGACVTVNHVMNLISRVSGRPLTIRRDPAQRGDMRHTYAETSRARQDLGFAPSVTLEEGLRQQYRWHETARILA
jgi:nucleoside-diphosphate-sugar epimerase